MRIPLRFILTTALGLSGLSAMVRGAFAADAQPPAASGVVRPPSPAPPQSPRVSAPPTADAPPPGAGQRANPRSTTEGPRIQLALLLDVSGSMEGLLEQAKAQLWNVVNELGRAKRHGVVPSVEIALFVYGEAGSPDEIRAVLPFTTNVDLVSEKLFALHTSGGFEPAGEVISRAVRELEWSNRDDSLKLLFIVGNEPLQQGRVDWRHAVTLAKERYIILSTIHCGDQATGVAHGWRDAALLAGGSFLHIDHNRAVAELEIVTPHDAELAKLGAAINTTYVPYGAAGGEGQSRQQQQDNNSWGLSSSNMASRSASKASAAYDNSGWDLVDAVTRQGVDPATLRDEDLPVALRGKDRAARRAYVAEKAAERERIKARIQELNRAREAFILEKRRKSAQGKVESLDTAIVSAIRAQAERKQFVLN